jgi:DNA-binding Xre family transcriptional regulator
MRYEAMTIVFTLEELMNKRGVTYRQISEEAGVSTNTLYKMVKKAPSGDMNTIGLDTIDRLCGYFGIEPGELIIRVSDEDSSGG